MGKVKYATGIDYVSGSLAKPTKKNGHTCGSYLIGTHRVAPTQSPDCTRMYIRTVDAYKRTTPVGSDELTNRLRFTAIAASVAERAKDLSKRTADQQAFLAQKDLPGGKQTLKAWYWMVEGEAYDQQH